MPLEDIVENGEEARIALERVRSWRHGRGAANCEGRTWGRGVEVGEEVAVGDLRMGEDFLHGTGSTSLPLLDELESWKLTMLGLEDNVDSPRVNLANRCGENKRVECIFLTTLEPRYAKEKKEREIETQDLECCPLYDDWMPSFEAPIKLLATF